MSHSFKRNIIAEKECEFFERPISVNMIVKPMSMN